MGAEGPTRAIAHSPRPRYASVELPRHSPWQRERVRKSIYVDICMYVYIYIYLKIFIHIYIYIKRESERERERERERHIYLRGR